MTPLAVDTSVAIPLVGATHAAHDAVTARCAGRRLPLAGQAAVETYAVLTRLPGDLRLDPADALRVLDARFAPSLQPTAATAERAPALLAQPDVADGAAHDGLVALAARDTSRAVDDDGPASLHRRTVAPVPGAAMTTIIRGPRPREVEAWLERRRRLGLDRFDEVWEGRYVVPPDPHLNHGRTQLGVAALLLSAARRLGLHAAGTFNLGGPADYRVPDAGLIPVPPAVWHDRATLVVEVLSPDDGTFDKLDFYRDHAARELLVLDWTTRGVRVIDLQEGHAERPDSTVLGMSTREISEAIDWPPLAG